MSDDKPLADAPAQQASADKTIAKRAERAKREAEADAERKAADDDADAREDAEAAHADEAAAHPPGTTTTVRPVVPGSDIGPVDPTQTESIAAANAAMNIGQRGQPPGAPAGEVAPAVDRDPGNPDPNARMPTAEQDADDHARREADDAAKAEEAKADRAKRGVTGAENGDPAGVAFGARITQAQFDHRNQGHDDTMQLLDDMLLALQRLEAKAAGDGK